MNTIIDIAKLLWDKNLATGFNGNISTRQDFKEINITATKTSLGFLKDSDILFLNLENGQYQGQGRPSTETLMHTEIYKNFANVKAIIHTHPTYTVGFFLSNDTFEPKTFEAKFYLGSVEALAQTTPSVTDTVSLVNALKKNNIVVLKNHGVVAVGENLFDCFVLIQELEEQVKMDLVDRHYLRIAAGGAKEGLPNARRNEDIGDTVATGPADVQKKYKLFSKEQINAIVDVVNNDTQMKELGIKTAMNMTLAVVLDETQQKYRFTFENGMIKEIAQDANAEFVINAPENVWRAVFNREIDPFVATTQKKMTLKGDFARISKWYAPCSRIFQVWTQVAVE